MTGLQNRLHELYDRQGQSPWVDNLVRDWLEGGYLASLVASGIRGVTSNPTIFAKAIEGSAAYDEQFAALVPADPVEAAYWELVVRDITQALEVLGPLYERSEGGDGFASLEVAPRLAHDTAGTVAAANQLHERIALPNLLVKVPATEAGLTAIEQLVGTGRSVNVTLIFGLDRYDAVVEAYLSGLEALVRSGWTDLSRVHSVASFFVSRVDTEVDRRLEVLAGPEGRAEILALRGQAAVAQAKVAYQHFLQAFRGPRWEALAARGARTQRPLWASTSTKNPAYPDLLYVDSLIGPDTVNTMPEGTIEAFLDHGSVSRTLDAGVEDAVSVLERLGEVGVDMADVAATLEEQGVRAFAASFDDLLRALAAKAAPAAVGTGSSGVPPSGVPPSGLGPTGHR
ncbi:MAG TPA: transaldolase [Acidimicrobiales bacterium]|nr:transaldolase [Acidimicrobiales bacterium]